MKLIEGKPAALPGSCYVCSSASRVHYVDLEMDVDFHGAMYLCDLCIKELGSLIGMLPEEEKTKLQLANMQLHHDNEKLEGEISGLRKVIDGYDDVRASLHASSQPLSSFGDSEQASAKGKGKLGGGEEGPSKQSDDEGMAVVRSGKPGSKSTEF